MTTPFNLGVCQIGTAPWPSADIQPLSRIGSSSTIEAISIWQGVIISDDDVALAMLSVPPFGGPGTGGRVIADADGSHRVVVNYDDVPGPWVYTVEGRLVDDKAMITKLLVAQRDPAKPMPITQTGLRRVQLRLIFDRIKCALRTDWSKRVSRLLGDARTQMPKAGRSWHAEHYLQVAWFYVEAEASGRAPRQAIAKQWDVSPVTASRWLSEARKRGYLAPYLPGQTEHTAAGLWSRQRFATSTVEMSVVRAFLDRAVREAIKASPETALDTILDRLLTLGGEAISRTTATENGKHELIAEAFFTYLFALAEHSETESLRSAAAALVDALVADGQTEDQP
ncbi:hypothetical protein [Nocardia anaemiae]|uniref:hypothetical protein n=1 Tax=Nocardia anaemiae TaxID=263910 RepID=UPI0012F503F4|nr:hypothetical protein [Nocardia anaemiae]